jgi:hypothetical protein
MPVIDPGPNRRGRYGMVGTGERSKTYVFGTTRSEVERLVNLEPLLEPLLEASTWRFLQEAEILKGMNVLDVGCEVGP